MSMTETAAALNALSLIALTLVEEGTSKLNRDLAWGAGSFTGRLVDHFSDSDQSREATIGDLRALLQQHQPEDPLVLIDLDTSTLESMTVAQALAQESWEYVGYILFPVQRSPKWLFISPIELPTYGYRMYVSEF